MLFCPCFSEINVMSDMVTNNCIQGSLCSLISQIELAELGLHLPRLFSVLKFKMEN